MTGIEKKLITGPDRDDEFRKRCRGVQVLMTAIGSALEGMNAAKQLLQQSARQIAENGPQPEALVDTRIADTSFRANLQVARTASELDEAALDILA